MWKHHVDICVAAKQTGMNIGLFVEIWSCPKKQNAEHGKFTKENDDIPGKTPIKIASWVIFLDNGIV